MVMLITAGTDFSEGHCRPRRQLFLWGSGREGLGSNCGVSRALELWLTIPSDPAAQSLFWWCQFCSTVVQINPLPHFLVLNCSEGFRCDHWKPWHRDSCMLVGPHSQLRRASYSSAEGLSSVVVSAGWEANYWDMCHFHHKLLALYFDVLNWLQVAFNLH